MRKRHYRSIGALAAVFLLPAIQAFACPDLGGTYDCPAAGNQPPMTLLIKRMKTVEDGALYTITYRIMGKDLVAEYDVPPKSLSKSTDTASCTDTALLHKESDGGIVQMSLNSAGNFERSKGGKVEVVCNSKNKGPGG
ncbi:MAG: hypothetical protein JOY81_05885 [Alphaproteobacteria bacterium]|nr:hypothetical protein [Alphaproteobacteria bacterium]